MARKRKKNIEDGILEDNQILDETCESEPVEEESLQENQANTDYAENTVIEQPLEEKASEIQENFAEKTEEVVITTVPERAESQPIVTEVEEPKEEKFPAVVEFKCLVEAINHDPDIKTVIPGAWWQTLKHTPSRRPLDDSFFSREIGVFGTLKVNRNGLLMYVKHSDFAKRIKRFVNKTADEFIILYKTDKEDIAQVKVVVTF